MKKVICIIGAGIVAVLLTATTVYACCGMYPSLTVTVDPEPSCLGVLNSISGTISATETWGGSYSTDASVAIEIESPSGVVTQLTVTLSNLVEVAGPPPSASWDYSATFTPDELGTYDYAVSGTWTTWYGSETETVTGTFEVDICMALDIKGGSCPNPLNRKSKGGTPVAILSDPATLAQIDLSTVLLGGVAPMEYKDGTIMMTMEDSTEPGDYDPADCYDCFDADDPANYNADLIDATLIPPGPGQDGVLDTYIGDGTDELVLKFDLSGVAGDPGDCVELTLTGQLLDGTDLGELGVLSDAMVITK